MEKINKPIKGFFVYGLRGIALALFIGVVINVAYEKFFKYGSDGVFYGTEASYFVASGLSLLVVACGSLCGLICGIKFYTENRECSLGDKLIFWAVSFILAMLTLFLFFVWMASLPGASFA